MACLGLTLFGVVVSAVIGIHGDFPLNDDWAYAQTTHNFLETGRFERTSWTWAPVITHTAVGAVFSKVCGYSFETLRLSGLFMGWLGVLGTYALCRQVGARPRLAVLGASLVALNPLHVNLSHTYMTDVPFATLTTWSLVLLCRGLARRSWTWLALGTVLAVSAVLLRQPGLAIPVALVIALVATRPCDKGALVAACLITIATALAHFVVPNLVFGPHDSGTMFGFSHLASNARSSSFLWRCAVNGLAQFCYLGVFLAPVTVGIVTLARGASRRVAVTSLVLTSALLCATVAYDLLPYRGNVIYDVGVGPALIDGVEQLPRIGVGISYVLTGIGFAAGFLALGALVHAAWVHRRAIRAHADRLLLALVPLIYLPPLLTRSPCFDRYLLPVLPPLVALLLLLPPPIRRGTLVRRQLGFAALVVLGVFAVAGTRDYLERNRCQWTLLEILLREGVGPEEIDGGFEFRNRDENKTALSNGAPRDTLEKRVVVSLAESLPGYRVVRQLSYQRLLPPGRQTITVFERERAR
jgi:4-amino-4-deoxy-L-arabinose transferase-like glycosyltransferase